MRPPGCDASIVRVVCGDWCYLAADDKGVNAGFSGKSAIRLLLALLCGAVGIFLRLKHIELPPLERRVSLGTARAIGAVAEAAWAVLPLMAGIGFFTGIAGPSRDLLVRRAAMARFGQAAYGRIYGFVYSGLDTGLAVAPLVFGGYMDRGQFATVLVGVALLQGAAILTALKVARSA